MLPDELRGFDLRPLAEALARLLLEFVEREVQGKAPGAEPEAGSEVLRDAGAQSPS